jgi:hypothetical protein
MTEKDQALAKSLSVAVSGSLIVDDVKLVIRGALESQALREVAVCITGHQD